ncbi:class I SAM-dependent methyltransferase [Chloroflexota bacterium]
MKKADYREIAGFYDKGRSLSEQNMDLWLGLISRYSGAGEGARVLDLGCGTGRFAIPMAVKLNFRVNGADSYPEMLTKAQEKDTGKTVIWNCMDAQNLKYADSSFDVVFVSHLLHHVDSPAEVLSDCNRILGNSGVILIRYGAIEQIRNDVEHTFFPETLDIDEPRTPGIETVEKWLIDAGFSGIKTEEVVQKTYESTESHLQAITVKATSVMTMISPQAHEQGLQKLAEYVEENPDDPWLMHDRMALTVGHKRKDG